MDDICLMHSWHCIYFYVYLIQFTEFSMRKMSLFEFLLFENSFSSFLEFQ
jgi:hypothetical protein